VRLTPRRRSDGDAPSRGPVAAYAGILDGRHLWLALESGGRAGLHDPATGSTVELADEVTDLLSLLPAGAATYDVVQGGRPVWGPPRPAGDPTRVPVAPDGLTQLSLERTEAGHLRVTRRPVPPTALLQAIELRDGDAHLTLLPPGDPGDPGGIAPGTHLLLLDADDELLDQLPVTAHDGRVEALLGVADLPAGHFGVVRLALGTETDWVRIRRRRSDLADPHRAVLLPELHGPDGDPEAEEDAPRARFRWNPDSHLVLRVLDPDDSGPPATVTPMAGRS
jgi:hypothetical protein